MRKIIFTLAGATLLAASTVSAQTLDRQVDSAGARGPGALPGSTGTPADIVTVPLGTAGAVAGGALNAAGTVVTAPIDAMTGRPKNPAINQ